MIIRMNTNSFTIFLFASLAFALSGCSQEELTGSSVDEASEVHLLHVKIADADASATRTGVQHTNGYRRLCFTSDDVLRLYDADAVISDDYTVVPGTENRLEASFSHTGSLAVGNPSFLAVPAGSIAGVSKDASGNVSLKMTVSPSFVWADAEPSEANTVVKADVAMWADVKHYNAQTGDIQAEAHALTGFLRLNLFLLPEGTKKVAVTSLTGSSGNYTENNAAPLSGTFATRLDFDKHRNALGAEGGSSLSPRIELTLPEAVAGRADRVLILPIIAQHYDALRIELLDGSGRTLGSGLNTVWRYAGKELSASSASAEFSDGAWYVKNLTVKPGFYLNMRQSGLSVTLADEGLFWGADNTLRMYDGVRPRADLLRLWTGSGTAMASFTPAKATVVEPDLLAGPDDMLRLLGASNTGGMQIQFFLSRTYTWENLSPAAPGTGAYLGKVPVWGYVESGDEGTSGSVYCLTGMLRLDQAAMPAGTSSVVVSSSDEEQPLAGRFVTEIDRLAPTSVVLAPNFEDYVYYDEVKITLPSATTAASTGFCHMPIPAAKYAGITVKYLSASNAVLKQKSLQNVTVARGGTVTIE